MNNFSGVIVLDTTVLRGQDKTKQWTRCQTCWIGLFLLEHTGPGEGEGGANLCVWFCSSGMSRGGRGVVRVWLGLQRSEIYSWKAERCRTASWRYFQFFGIIFASQKGMLRAFHPCHIGTLDFALCPRWIFWLKILEAIFRWHLLFLLQKNTHRKFGVKFGGKIRWKHSVFRYVFRCVFRYVFRWTAFCLEIGKIRAESVLQERPFNIFETLFMATLLKISGGERTWVTA